MIQTIQLLKKRSADAKIRWIREIRSFKDRTGQALKLFCFFCLTQGLGMSYLCAGRGNNAFNLSLTIPHQPVLMTQNKNVLDYHTINKTTWNYPFLLFVSWGIVKVLWAVSSYTSYKNKCLKLFGVSLGFEYLCSL